MKRLSIIIALSCVLFLLSYKLLTMVYNKYENNKTIKYLNNLEKASLNDDAPPSLTTFFLIEKYSKLYSIPKYIVYNIAYRETNYKGPFDWDYYPFVTSNAGAHGAMQIKLSTANEINDTTTKRAILKNNLEYNISTCFKLLDTLYRRYHDWGKVCGCYNTGSPVSNDYSRFCASNKDYRKNWVNYNE